MAAIAGIAVATVIIFVTLCVDSFLSAIGSHLLTETWVLLSILAVLAGAWVFLEECDTW